MNARTQIDPPSLPLLRQASTLIAMGTVGLALVFAGPASADTVKPKPKPKVTTTAATYDTTWEVTGPTQLSSQDRRVALLP
jgi:hypothetical protein